MKVKDMRNATSLEVTAGGKVRTTLNMFLFSTSNEFKICLASRLNDPLLPKTQYPTLFSTASSLIG